VIVVVSSTIGAVSTTVGSQRPVVAVSELVDRFLTPTDELLTSYRAFSRFTASTRGGRMQATVEVWTTLDPTSGAFRKMMTTVSPNMFPRDPVRAAAAIYEVVASESPRHWVVLGSDAHRRIGAKLDRLIAEFEAGADTARSTDYPGSPKAIL